MAEKDARGQSLVRQVAVFGADDRESLPARYRALEHKIGLLYDQRSHSVCSAFCVGEGIVATAAHCLFRTVDERPPRLADFTFRILAKSGRAITPISGASSGSASQNVVAGSTRLSVRPPIDASSDWALVKLASPICKAGGLNISRRTAASLGEPAVSRAVYQVAFHRDFANWQLAFAAPCDVRRNFANAEWPAVARDFKDPDRLILHTCDTAGASSGSPLLIDGPFGPEVVGINVGTYVQSRVLMQNGEVIHRFKSDTVANTGVSSAAFLPALDAFEHSQIVADRRSVKELQSLLTGAGFYAGSTDGVYGPALRAAIASFETAEGHPVTGIASAELLRRLHARNAQHHHEIAAEPQPGVETGSLGRATTTATKPR